MRGGRQIMFVVNFVVALTSLYLESYHALFYTNIIIFNCVNRDLRGPKLFVSPKREFNGED